MKRLVVLAVSVFLATPALPAEVRAQANAREILERAIEKLGGETYLAVEDVETVGRYYQFQNGELSGGEGFTDYLKFPDKERTEFGEKGETVRINNGREGWNITDKGKKVAEQLPEQIEVFWDEFKVTLDFLLRVVLGQEETTLQYVGRDMIDFKRVDILEIRDEDRTRINLYIDRADGLLMRKTVRRLSDPSVHEEVYSNYHDIQGVLTPLLIDRYTDGLKTMQIRFQEVRYNSGLQDRFFRASPQD